MLKTLEKETGIALNFKSEILTKKAGLNTVLLRLADTDNNSYILAISYDEDIAARPKKAKEQAIWYGTLFNRSAALFKDKKANLSYFKAKVSPTVQIYKGDLRPDFSLSRFESLYKGEDVLNLLITEEGKQTILPILLKEKRAVLGTWMSKISRSAFLAAVSFIFENYRQIETAEYKNLPYSALLDRGWRHNDFFMVLPSNVEELRKNMTGKSRYNLKREKRIIEEKFGELSLINISADNVTSEIIDTFYRFKTATHEITKADYDITKLPLTDYYILKTGDGAIRAIALSCEQGKDVFIENHTFDPNMREYSFGKQLYEMYIEALIKKGKTGLALAGGNLDYKNRYGTFCAITYSGEVERSAYKAYKILRRLGLGNNPLAIKKWAARATKFKKQTNILGE